MEATPRRSSLSARVNSLEGVVEELSGALEAQLAHAAIYAEVEESLLAREEALLAREAVAAEEDQVIEKALRSRCCGFPFFYFPGTPVQLPWIFPAACAGLGAAYALIVTSPTPANAAAARAAAAAAARALAEAQSARSVFVATVLRILSLFTSLAVADEVDIPYIGVVECGQDLRVTAGWGLLGLCVGVILATLYILPPMQKMTRSYRAHVNSSSSSKTVATTAMAAVPASDCAHVNDRASHGKGKAPSVADLSLELPVGSRGLRALASEAEAAALATPISQKLAALSPRTFAAASAAKPRLAPASPLAPATGSPSSTSTFTSTSSSASSAAVPAAAVGGMPFASPFRTATSPVARAPRVPGSAVRLTPAAARWLLAQAGHVIATNDNITTNATNNDDYGEVDDDNDDDDEEEEEEEVTGTEYQQQEMRENESSVRRKQKVQIQLPEPSPTTTTSPAAAAAGVHTDAEDLQNATRELMYGDYFGSPPVPTASEAGSPLTQGAAAGVGAAAAAAGTGMGSVGVSEEDAAALADVSLAVSSSASAHPVPAALGIANNNNDDEEGVSFGRMIDHTYSTTPAALNISHSTSRKSVSSAKKSSGGRKNNKADQTAEEAHIAAMLASAPKAIDDSWAQDDAAVASPVASDYDDDDDDDEEEEEEEEEDGVNVGTQEMRVGMALIDEDEDEAEARAVAAAAAAAAGTLTAEDEAFVAEIDSSRVLAALAAASPTHARSHPTHSHTFTHTPAHSHAKPSAPVSAAALAAAAAAAEAAEASAAAVQKAQEQAQAQGGGVEEEEDWPQAPVGVRTSLESVLNAAATATPTETAADSASTTCASGASGDAGAVEDAEDVVASLIAQADVLAAQHRYPSLYSLLSAPTASPATAAAAAAATAAAVSSSAELLWRRARAAYHTAKELAAAGDAQGQRARVAAGAADAAAAVAADDASPMAHKWVAILSNEVGKLGGQQEKIRQAFVFQEHTRKAIALAPNDPDLQHMLGRFCLEISSVSWAVRRIASVAFGGLPSASVDEALAHFQAAARGEPAWPLNMAWMGKALAKLSRSGEAREVLEAVLSMPVVRAEDEEAQELARKELAAL